ncbi:DUF2938 domain-containing protein [Bradyrhizobium sp. LjRoot220]|uniref:DUF2938 domain-containing protein n=1 Tax=Bradyrhizobium sp. LjRoot220 TaxID=3342284 RepID=UPI003ECF805B
MVDASDYLKHAIPIGIGATALMDAWAIARTRLLGIPGLDYALLGRWLGHMIGGRFRHEHIASSRSVRGERAIGWAAHYLTGIGFAVALLVLWGLDWAHHPTIGPALIVGIGSTAAPFLLMQPGMGAGIAGSRTSRAAAVRIQTIVTHLIFSAGLYVAGLVVRHLN